MMEERQKARGDLCSDNLEYISLQLKRMRLLLQRRILWQRLGWKDDPLQIYQGLVISDDQADRLMEGDDRQAENAFYLKDPQAAEASRLIAQLEEELEARRADGTRPLPAIEVLVHLFKLSAFERDILLLCLAVELEPDFERLYAYAQDDATRRYPTPRLASNLLGSGDPLAEMDRFLPKAPLRRYQLVNLGGSLRAPMASSRLCLDERIASYILGEDIIDERLSGLLEPIPICHLAASHQELAERLVRAVSSFPSHNSHNGPGLQPVLNLIGPTETSKRAVSQFICKSLGLGLYVLAYDRLPPPGQERKEILRLLERDMLLSGFAFYLDQERTDAGDRVLTSTSALDDVIGALSGLLIAGGRSLLRSARETILVEVAGASSQDQQELWMQTMGDEGIAPDAIASIAEQFNFGAEDIASALASARVRAAIRSDRGDLTPEDLWQACRERAGGRLSDLAQKVTPCYTWEDLIVPGDVLSQLKEIASQVSCRPCVYDRWGFGEKLSRGRGISALFAGSSGTGKTMAAEVLANHLRLDLYRVDLSGVVSKYIGETEKNLRAVFDSAEKSGAILFFDEADALFGRRSEVKDSHDRYANIEVSYLLQRMEDYRGLAILATNKKNALDQAFLRRLRFLVDFPFPDMESRRRIWQRVFPSRASMEDLDFSALSRLEIAGGNIRNAALNAAFLAAGKGSAIEMRHVMHAVRREYAKIEKMATEAEFGKYSER
jgi:SpoVK/Ycf46/Vps4 family AAA+-type ATPase